MYEYYYYMYVFALPHLRISSIRKAICIALATNMYPNNTLTELFHHKPHGEHAHSAKSFFSLSHELYLYAIKRERWT